jgi:subtilisin family serine protease
MRRIRPIDPFSTLVCGLCLLLVAVGAATAAQLAPRLSEFDRVAIETSGIVGREVVRELDRQGAARVIVSFEVRSRVDGQVLSKFASAEAQTDLLAAAAAVLRAVPESHFELKRQYAAINALAGVTDAEGVLALLTVPGVGRVDFDLPGMGQLLESKPLATVDLVNQMGLTGRSVTAIVIDSGADRKHKALKKAIKGGECFCETAGGCCPNGTARQSGKKAAQDDNGHGSHVSGIVASRGKGGAPKGVAPGANLLPIKVLAADNSFCCYSDVLAALDHAVEHVSGDSAAGEARAAAGGYVVNMSLGTNALFKKKCDKKIGALSQATKAAIGALADMGVPVFASSGNDGSKDKMSLPACISNVIAVGAIYDDFFNNSSPGEITGFTNSNGQTDLVAPGWLLTSVALGGRSVAFGGTSMASPMAAGCAALLRQDFPEATARQLELALESGPRVRDSKNRRRFPSLDCYGAWRYLDERL